jgi:hypothetical protein
MNRNMFVLAQSLLGDTLEWITSSFGELYAFVRDWLLASFNARVLGVITAMVVLVAIFARVRTGRQL